MAYSKVVELALFPRQMRIGRVLSKLYSISRSQYQKKTFSSNTLWSRPPFRHQQNALILALFANLNDLFNSSQGRHMNWTKNFTLTSMKPITKTPLQEIANECVISYPSSLSHVRMPGKNLDFLVVPSQAGTS